jgi:uncharacterized protein (DUF2141 family)
MRDIAAALVITFCGCSSGAFAGTVEVDVVNVSPGAGDVKVALCDSDLEPDRCGRTTTAAAAAGSVRVAFPDVPPGRYAVAAYQDVDGTGALRRGKLGIPLEPFGFSNGAGLSRKPTFEAAAFAVSEGGRRISVSLRRPRRRAEGDQ